MRRWTIGLLYILLTAPLLTTASQDHRLLLSAFESAARESNVPADVLKGIAFAQTRWQHLEWADGDTANCLGMPHGYGVMNLRDDDWFGHSLREAAELVGQDITTLKKDPSQNIQGAAALLRKLHGQLPLPDGTRPDDLESWESAIAAYCGIPQQHLAHQHALDIFDRLTKGYNQYDIELLPRSLNLTSMRQRVAALWHEAEKQQMQKLQKAADKPDYPGAKWASAYPGHWYASGNARDFVVIHDMEGYYLSVISYFQQQGTQASAHYCINGLKDNAGDADPGEITQMVEEQYWAWHARCWNTYSMGIEHEGFAGNPAWFTPEMYFASANLTRYLCEKYSIPKDRNHIIAHGEWQNSSWVSWVNTTYKQKFPSFDPTCNNHTDPGTFWDWDFYMQLVKQDLTAPRVTSQPPAARVQVSEKISVTFNQRMEPNSTKQNFKISPPVQGSFSWANNFRTLEFTPTTFFAFNSTYSVTIDTGAHNYLNARLDVDGDGIGGEAYTFSFQTVELDTIPPELVSTYPADTETDISRSAEFIVQFNEPLDPSTLSGAFELREVGTGEVATTGLTHSSGPGFSRVRFRPAVELKPSSAYQLIVNQQAKDFGGNSIPSSRTASFTTEPVIAFGGTVIDAVDQIGGWWQPSTSGSTVGVQASFSIATDIKKAGTGSGKIVYNFTQASGGVLRDHNSSTPSIEGGSLFGIWVYGDKSGNQLEYWFYYPVPGATGFIIIPVGPINWTGWKLKTISTSQVPIGSGTGRRFASFGIRQLSGASVSGTVYFDQLTVGNAVTGVESEPASALPTSFALHQNYPNPFNPTTTISFDLPQRGHVRLSVYDMLGQEVATLANSVFEAGKYRLAWNASTIASGVYFYRLESEGFIEARKMVLLR